MTGGNALYAVHRAGYPWRLKKQAGNNLPEFSQSRTKLWQALLTLPSRRPKDRSPTRTPAGNLRSGRAPGTGWAERKDWMGPSTLWHQRQLVEDPLSPVLDGRPVQISRGS